ncbi:hypothetical protein NC653_012031 [Populus alba x Populus x berolinensis]|uniref:Uncharacterized protein n=1 Tax=Populus alba x Populus x berolinensis TaxID=444605 RepID=A0AAD6R4W9_9ROSI|nr:hypothetical protein NC653_012031 [Populus alba x Populus x berolinensis]
MIVHDQIPRAGGREEKTEHPTWKLSSLVRLWRWRVPDSAMPPEDYIRWTSLVEVGQGRNRGEAEARAPCNFYYFLLDN